MRGGVGAIPVETQWKSALPFLAWESVTGVCHNPRATTCYGEGVRARGVRDGSSRPYVWYTMKVNASWSAVALGWLTWYVVENPLGCLLVCMSLAGYKRRAGARYGLLLRVWRR